MAWLADIKHRYNTIPGGIRAFVDGVIQNPTAGSANEFKDQLTEAEQIALYVCINEKIPRPLLRGIWKTNEQCGAGVLHALIQHAFNPVDKGLLIKRQAIFFVDTKALDKPQNFQAVYAQLQTDMMNVRWSNGTTPAELIEVVEGVFSNVHTISQSIRAYWDASEMDQEAVDETMAQIPKYMNKYMELNRLANDKEEAIKDKDKKQRFNSDSSSQIRSQKPPLEKTPEAERILNGPCKFHKKGDCAWKEYCNMDHSDAAMTKIQVWQPRSQHSVRNANKKANDTTISQEDLEALIERIGQLEDIVEEFHAIQSAQTSVIENAPDASGDAKG